MEGKSPERKKRYGWLLFFTLLNWLLVAGAIVLIDPEAVRDFLFPGSYLPIMVLLASAVFLLLSILFLSSRIALRWTVAIIGFAYLRLWGIGTILNGVLILGLMISLEVYLRSKESAML